ncbi:MAG: hypothetical protein AAFV59_15485 [Pseudomonadota bacterium]
MTTRRTKAEMETIRDGIYEFAKENQPVTIRQTFYHLVAHGIIPKCEKQYRMISTQATNMRRDGELPYDWITDVGRSEIEPLTFKGMAEALRSVARTYGRNPWDNQPVYLQVWVEKAAMQALFSEITIPLCVPLYVSKGQSSVTFIRNAAERIKEQTALGKRSVILCYGDHDLQGIQIPEATAKGLWNDHGCDCEVLRMAVNEDQIEELNLPTRDAKDSAKKQGWDKPTVDIDAIPPAILKQMLYTDITDHIEDADAWNKSFDVEADEREQLEVFIQGFGA